MGELRCYLNKKDYLVIHLIDYAKPVRKSISWMTIKMPSPSEMKFQHSA